MQQNGSSYTAHLYGLFWEETRSQFSRSIIHASKCSLAGFRGFEVTANDNLSDPNLAELFYAQTRKEQVVWCAFLGRFHSTHVIPLIKPELFFTVIEIPISLSFLFFLKKEQIVL